MSGEAPPPSAPGMTTRNRRTLLLVALVTIAPVIASYAAYYWFPREKQANYGELLATPATDVGGTLADGAPFRLSSLRGRWIMAMAAPGECARDCVQALYATRQARTIQGREMDRLARVLLVTTDAAPSATLLAEHPDLVVVRAGPAALVGWPGGDERLYLVDPLGNLVLSWPRDPDIKAVAKDVTRLLRASRIG